jgi:hypothetical protein
VRAMPPRSPARPRHPPPCRPRVVARCAPQRPRSPRHPASNDDCLSAAATDSGTTGGRSAQRLGGHTASARSSVTRTTDTQRCTAPLQPPPGWKQTATPQPVPPGSCTRAMSEPTIQSGGGAKKTPGSSSNGSPLPTRCACWSANRSEPRPAIAGSSAPAAPAPKT